jgi:GNAT superfamily N-acetyltransferase
MIPTALPPLANGFHDVPRGKVALLTLSLDMPAPPPVRPDPPGSERFSMRRVPAPGLDWYRDLYRAVGARWMWFSRLRMPDAVLAATLNDPGVEVYALDADGRQAGLLELDFRQMPVCELAFFGLTPDLIGAGAGRWLMNRALDLAWSRPIERLWVHTCAADHPGAPAFYVRSGFRPVSQQVEVADDPRLTGESPPDASPHIPIVA